MTRLEKLKAVQSAYCDLLEPKSIRPTDYNLIFWEIPKMLCEMIYEEAADATRELLAKEKETKTCGK